MWREIFCAEILKASEEPLKKVAEKALEKWKKYYLKAKLYREVTTLSEKAHSWEAGRASEELMALNEKSLKPVWKVANYEKMLKMTVMWKRQWKAWRK